MGSESGTVPIRPHLVSQRPPFSGSRGHRSVASAARRLRSVKGPGPSSHHQQGISKGLAPAGNPAGTMFEILGGGMTMWLKAVAIAAAVAVAGPCLAADDDYPARPVRIIVPFAPGGSTD